MAAFFKVLSKRTRFTETVYASIFTVIGRPSGLQTVRAHCIMNRAIQAICWAWVSASLWRPPATQ